MNKKPSFDSVLAKLQAKNALVDANKVKGGTAPGMSDCHTGAAA
jgi:hypothetical protein